MPDNAPAAPDKPVTKPDTRFKKGKSGNLKGRPRADARESEARFTGDGWANTYSGLGVEGKDKRIGGAYWCPDYISYEQAKAMWRASSIAHRIVTVWPNDMLRKGWALNSENPDVNKRVLDRAQELEANSKIGAAMEFRAAYGGGVVLIGVNDGQAMDQPLNMEGIISLDFLTVLEHRECVPIKWYEAPTKGKYNEPELYRIGTTATAGSPVELYVHESRLIVFDGIRVSRERTGDNYGFGDSVFVRCNQALADFEAGCAAIGILVTDFAPNVFKMKGLLGIVAAEGAEAATSFAVRMRALALGKSVANAALVDSEDEYKRETVNVTGLAELWDRLCVRLAAIADMPVTLLMGQSPKGLGNEGESDLRFHYDKVATRQEKDLLPQLNRLVKIILAALKVTLPTWEVKFHPLHQPTELEQAQARSVQAATDEKNIQNQVYTSEEVRNSRGDGNTLTMSIDIDEDEESATDEEKATLRDPNAPVGEEPALSSAPDPKGTTVGGAPAPAGEAVQATAFNGTQISGAKDIILSVINEEMSRESGVALLTIMFPITTAQAEAMLGPKEWKPKPPEPVIPFGGAPMPGAPGKPGMVPPKVMPVEPEEKGKPSVA